MKRLAFILIILSLVLLSGCNGYREIDRGYLATAVGISESGGKVCIYIEAVSSQGFTDKSSQRVVLLGKDDDIYSAYKNLTQSLVKPVYFEQLGAVVFDINLSTELVENGLKLLDGLDGTNLGIYLVKTNNVPKLFEVKQEGGILGYDIIGLIKIHEKEKGVTLSNQLYQFRRNTHTLPLVTVDEDKLILEVV